MMILKGIVSIISSSIIHVAIVNQLLEIVTVQLQHNSYALLVYATASSAFMNCRRSWITWQNSYGTVMYECSITVIYTLNHFPFDIPYYDSDFMSVITVT